ncbi:MAG: transglycosylase, partial [Rhodoferax sp.]|nr:transglycosylase [Rhodoferax sp.]
MKKLLRPLFVGGIVGTLVACSSPPIQAPTGEPVPMPATAPVVAPMVIFDPDDTGPLPSEIVQVKSRWTPVRWA